MSPKSKTRKPKSLVTYVPVSKFLSQKKQSFAPSKRHCGIIIEHVFKACRNGTALPLSPGCVPLSKFISLEPQFIQLYYGGHNAQITGWLWELHEISCLFFFNQPKSFTNKAQFPLSSTLPKSGSANSTENVLEGVEEHLQKKLRWHQNTELPLH